MTPLFLQLEYNRLGFPADEYGFTHEDRLNYAPYAIDYLTNAEDISYLGDLRLPKSKCIVTSRSTTDCAMYNTGELRHMRDVKTVTQYAFWLGIAVFIATAIVVGTSRGNPIRQSYVCIGLKNGAILTLSTIAAIVIGAVISWDFFFDTFHGLFFQSGTWRFAYSDTLIRLFPEQFWFDAAITIGTFTTLGAVIIVLIVRWWDKRPHITSSELTFDTKNR
jgi:integral membrane protein (TIGR01906 family)